jgi:hypothetical protein
MGLIKAWTLAERSISMENLAILDSPPSFLLATLPNVALKRHYDATVKKETKWQLE